MNTETIQQIKAILQRHPLEQAYLFGSQARGTNNALSDVDIAVCYLPMIDKEVVESNVFAELSQLLHTDAIDIIDIATASPLLAHRSVLRGIPLLESTPHAAAMLKTKILHAYEDTCALRAIKQVTFI